MKKFFVANSWGKNEAPLKFVSVPNKTNTETSASKKAKKKKKKAQVQEIDTNTDVVMGPRPPLAPPPTPPNTPSTPEPPKKYKSILNGRVSKKKNAKTTPESAKTEASSKLSTSFEKKLKENLMGGRFRFINEQLYTMTSKSATRLFKEDPSAFEAYHEGYRHQVEKWPTNPLNKVIKSIRKLPKDLVIGDFGCGEGKLAQSIPNKVYSIDLVSCRDDIIASDMSNTPLENECLNIAVYCLSLMGTNLNECLLEANRVLKMGGLLIIAEIQSRFEDVRQFIKSLENCGFSLTKKDTSIQLFYFFHFKKVKNVGNDAKIKSFSLKPCAYRKR